MTELDYQTAFHHAPIGMVLSRQRTIEDCNQAVADIFGTTCAALKGQSYLILYPSAGEFERIGERIVPIMNTKGAYSDERIMKRANGELFWCHVTGRALDRMDPLGPGIWTFEDLSTRRPVTTALTPREREIAAQLVEGKTSKQIGRTLNISPRTVEIHRSRLMKKFSASTTVELVQKLLGGQ